MTRLKTRIAAAATVLGLGGIAGFALGQNQGQATQPPVADKPAVHTKVIRRTIHVTRHAKPKDPAPAAVGAAGAAVESESAAAPITTSTSGAAASAAGESGAASITTSTSGGAGGGSGESEGGDGGGHDD